MPSETANALMAVTNAEVGGRALRFELGTERAQRRNGDRPKSGPSASLIVKSLSFNVDDDTLGVRNYQKRRVLKRLAVLKQLLVGFVQVGVLALVFPAEEMDFGCIGPARTPGRFLRAHLECEFAPGGVEFCRRRVAH